MKSFISVLLALSISSVSAPAQDPSKSSSEDSSEKVDRSQLAGSQENGKKPEPDRREVATATRKISRIFAKELATRDISQQIETIKTLTQTGIDEADPVMQFALLKLAHRQAVEICDSTLAVQAAKELDQRYQIDLWDLHLDSLKKLSRAARTPDQLRAVLQTYDTIVQLAADREFYAEAIRLVDAMNAASRKLRDPQLNDQIESTRDYLKFAQRLFDRWQQSITEKATETDQRFNKGLFLFFVKNDKAGLPLIALKPQTTIGKLAAAELAKPEDQKLVEVGKGWLEWSDSLSSKAKFESQVATRHAALVLQSVIPRLKGLEKKEVENLVAKLGDLDLSTSNSGSVPANLKSGSRWTMDWQSQSDWELLSILPTGKLEITIDGKKDTYPYTAESGALVFKGSHPHRVYYLEIENGVLLGRIVDKRDGRLVNKGEGSPVK